MKPFVPSWYDAANRNQRDAARKSDGIISRCCVYSEKSSDFSGPAFLLHRGGDGGEVILLNAREQGHWAR